MKLPFELTQVRDSFAEARQPVWERACRILDAIPDLTGGSLVPWPHQVDAVRRMTTSPYKGFILAAERGTGKTLAGAVAGHAASDKLVVVTAASAMEQWRRETARLGVFPDVYSWGSIPDPFMGDYAVIYDEAHRGKNPQAARTKAMLRLAHEASAVYLLTGSPIPNGRAMELRTLLEVTGHWLGQIPLPVYADLYAQTIPGFHGPAWSGLSNAHELRDNIADVLLWQPKTLLDLPPLTRKAWPVEPTQARRALWQKTFATIQQAHRERVRMGLSTTKGEAIVAMQALRHAGEWAKADEAVTLALEAMQTGEQVLVFSCYKDVAQWIRDQLDTYTLNEAYQNTPVRPGLINGDTSLANRQRQVDELTDGTRRALVSIFGAGGEALNLQAASTVILVGREWVPSAADQAEGRIDRMGQNRNTTSLWLTFGPVDRRIDDLLMAKIKASQSVLGGGADSVEPDLLDIFKEVFA